MNTSKVFFWYFPRLTQLLIEYSFEIKANDYIKVQLFLSGNALLADTRSPVAMTGLLR